MKIHIATEGPHGAPLTPANKRADVELHFEAGDGLLAGLKLVGFAVWDIHRRGLSVTMPARRYVAGTESRSFAVLRPRDHVGEEKPLTEAILAAYRAHVAGAAAGSEGPAKPDFLVTDLVKAKSLIRRHYSLSRPVETEEVVAEVTNLRRRDAAGTLDDRQTLLWGSLREFVAVREGA